MDNLLYDDEPDMLKHSNVRLYNRIHLEKEIRIELKKNNLSHFFLTYLIDYVDMNVLHMDYGD